MYKTLKDRLTLVFHVYNWSFIQQYTDHPYVILDTCTLIFSHNIERNDNKSDVDVSL